MPGERCANAARRWPRIATSIERARSPHPDHFYDRISRRRDARACHGRRSGLLSDKTVRRLNLERMHRNGAAATSSGMTLYCLTTPASLRYPRPASAAAANRPAVSPHICQAARGRHKPRYVRRKPIRSSEQTSVRWSDGRFPSYTGKQDKARGHTTWIG